MLPFFAYTFDALPAIAPEKAVLYLRSVQDPGNLGLSLGRRQRPMSALSSSVKVVSTSITIRRSAAPWGRFLKCLSYRM
mgnify:CR=1 FL=1